MRRSIEGEREDLCSSVATAAWRVEERGSRREVAEAAQETSICVRNRSKSYVNSRVADAKRG